jgi:hypothetical protein
MDIREIEQMRSLQRKYYNELRFKRRMRGIYVSSQVLFLYRLSVMFTLGFGMACLIKALD